MPRSFSDLQAWLSSFKTGDDGNTALCVQLGEPYTEVAALHLARPGDEMFAERVVALNMYRQINRMIGDRQAPRLFWRIRLETDAVPEPQIIEYRDDGPDRDFVTGQNCVMDHNWIGIRAYARLAVGGE